MQSTHHGLNNAQLEAVNHKDGPMLILAGAGAGKTKTLTHRIVELIKSGVPAHQILAITFTNKAGKEMRERAMNLIEKEIGHIASLPTLTTFHSFGVRVLKEEYERVGLKKMFTIADTADTNSMIKDAIIKIGLDPKQYEHKKFRSIISREKGEFVTVDEYRNKADTIFSKTILKIWEEYEASLKKENSVDFDDLLLKTVTLFQQHSDVLEKWQERYQYIHIDEYQDTNEVQYTLAKLLAKKYRNLCVVGDGDQCLDGDTKIKLSNGKNKKIKDIKKGDIVMSNYGSHDLRGSSVMRVKKLSYKGELIEIKTGSGKILKSTKDHMHFAGYRLGETPQMYLNYLMYKKEYGFRIGTTCIYTKSQIKSIPGFVQRSNQEHADALWVIATYPNENEARVGEYIFSLRYQIPTIPFVPRKGISKNGYVHDKEYLKKIFSSLHTEISGRQLISDTGLSFEYPHHRPQSINSKRRNINLTLCADRRGGNPMHLVSIHGNDVDGRKLLESIGISVRKSKGNIKNWRFETVRASYGEAFAIATKIASLFDEPQIILRARLGGFKKNVKDYNSLPHIPAGSVMRGMVLFGENGYEVVKSVKRINDYKGFVYDIDVDRTHNFLANGIFTHNCIYSWRGANVTNILNFEKDYTDAKIVILEENYRSTKNILAVANEIIKKNKNRKDKTLFTNGEDGALVGLYEGYDEKYEAEFVVDKITELLDQGVKGNEIAILYRANFQSRTFEDMFMNRGLPYHIVGTKFFDRKEVKDMISYMRASMNPDSLSDLKRIINVPTRGIGKTTILKIFADQRNELPKAMGQKVDGFFALLDEIRDYSYTHTPDLLIKFILEKTGLKKELENGTEEDKERLANIQELATVATKYNHLEPEEALSKFVEEVALVSDQDGLDEDNKSARLMTVHASKGLEFEYVFVVGLEHGLFPLERDGETSVDEKEEERRLFYVAVTRARKKLFLTYATIRTIFGQRQITVPSEFLFDVPEDLIEKEEWTSNLGRVIYL